VERRFSDPVKTFQILDTTYRRTKEGLVWGYELTAHRTGVVKLPPVEIRVGSQTFFDGSDRAEDCDDPSRERHEYPGRVRSPGTTSRLWYWLLWLSLLPTAYGLSRLLDRRLKQWLARFKAKGTFRRASPGGGSPRMVET